MKAIRPIDIAVVAQGERLFTPHAFPIVAGADAAVGLQFGAHPITIGPPALPFVALGSDLFVGETSTFGAPARRALFFLSREIAETIPPPQVPLMANNRSLIALYTTLRTAGAYPAVGLQGRRLTQAIHPIYISIVAKLTRLIAKSAGALGTCAGAAFVFVRGFYAETIGPPGIPAVANRGRGLAMEARAFQAAA